MNFRDFLKEIGYRIAGAAIAVGLIAGIVFLGDLFDLDFLQSEGGVLLTTILLMEAFFFTLIIGGVIYSEFKG